jgi:hypothetical protein
MLIIKKRNLSSYIFHFHFYGYLIAINKYQLKLFSGHLILVQSGVKTDFFQFYKLHNI